MTLQNSYSFLLICHSQTARCYHMLHYSLEEKDKLFLMSVHIFISIQFNCELHYDLVSTPSPVYFPLTFRLSNFISTNDHRKTELLEFSQFETDSVGEIQSVQWRGDLSTMHPSSADWQILEVFTSKMW